MRTNKQLNRSAWKQILATMVMGLSLGSTGFAQDNQGALRSRLLDRLDVDGDGKLSAEERQKIRSGFRQRGDDQLMSDAAIPEKLKSLYRCSAGPHAIETIATVKLTTAERTEPLQVRITYPKSTGQFPVIVFSHGAFGSKDNYDPIVRHWASYGYVVLQPTHGDSLSLLTPAERAKIIASGNPFAAVNINKHWRDRAEDVALIIKSLATIESDQAALRGKLDTTRIGMGGHSYGGNTTQLVGGLNLGVDLKVDGVKALLMLSPPGPNDLATPAMYTGITAPTLVVTGTNDHSPTNGKGYQWRLETYDVIPSQDKSLLFIEDANHNLGGISGATGRLAGGDAEPAHLAYVKSTSIAFWDTYLKSDPTAQKYFRSDELQQTSEQAAKLSHTPKAPAR
jgi:dienelactone hydrolase